MTYTLREVPSGERDDELSEAWELLDDTSSGLNVDVARWDDDDTDWPWTLTVWAMEFVEDEPFFTVFTDAIRAALETVPGVEAVDDDDIETWIIRGEPSAPEILEAVGEVVRSYETELLKIMNEEE